jgi:curved DNA-binding protein
VDEPRSTTYIVDVPDLYSVLGVPRSASGSEVKKAYRKLASKLHPDKNPGTANEKRFKEVTGAYEVIGDDKKRALYDEFGDISLQSGFDPQRAREAQHFGGFGGGGQNGHFDLGDIFAGGGGGGFGDTLGDLLRRSGRGGPRARAQAGQDLASTVNISFADAVVGTTIKLARADGGDPIQVRIPPGAEDQSRVRVAGKGGPGQLGGPAGDLLLTLRVQSHPHFTRQGDDLHVELPIGLGEAYRGAQIKVPTPHGDVKLTVPKGVQSGRKLRLRGKGVRRKNGPAGDLYVRLLVTVATDGGPEIEEAIDALDLDGPGLRAELTF